MPLYEITDTVTYRVQADTPEDAEQILVTSDNMDLFFNAVEDRDVVEITPRQSSWPTVKQPNGERCSYK